MNNETGRLRGIRREGSGMSWADDIRNYALKRALAGKKYPG